MANARKLGTAARTASRTDGSRSIRVSCSRRSLFLILLVELLEEIVESIRNALGHHVVVHGTKLLADLGPDIATEARFGLGGGRLAMHGRSRLSSLAIFHFHPRLPHPTFIQRVRGPHCAPV